MASEEIQMSGDEQEKCNSEACQAEADFVEAENRLSSDEILRTRVDKESVVGFIEGMMQAMGSAAIGKLPQQSTVAAKGEAQGRRYQSKTVGAIMQKLQRLEKYPDLVKEVQDDPVILEWLSRNGCKQKEYYDELECAQELTSFYGGYRRFDLAIQAASKALAITVLHRRDDEETVAELNWVLADLHAAYNRMDRALEFLNTCLGLLEPGANEEHPTYLELRAQLEETNKRSKELLSLA